MLSLFGAKCKGDDQGLFEGLAVPDFIMSLNYFFAIVSFWAAGSTRDG